MAGHHCNPASAVAVTAPRGRSGRRQGGASSSSRVAEALATGGRHSHRPFTEAGREIPPVWHGPGGEGGGARGSQEAAGGGGREGYASLELHEWWGLYAVCRMFWPIMPHMMCAGANALQGVAMHLGARRCIRGRGGALEGGIMGGGRPPVWQKEPPVLAGLQAHHGRRLQWLAGPTMGAFQWGGWSATRSAQAGYGSDCGRCSRVLGRPPPLKLETNTSRVCGYPLKHCRLQREDGGERIRGMRRPLPFALPSPPPPLPSAPPPPLSRPPGRAVCHHTHGSHQLR